MLSCNIIHHDNINISNNYHWYHYHFTSQHFNATTNETITSIIYS
jgi:hypothetical protein